MRTETAYALPELLIVLLLLAGTIALFVLRWPSPLGPASSAVRNFINQARLEAVALDRPVAVTFNDQAGTYELRQAADDAWLPSELCGSSTVTRTLDLRQYRGVTHAAPARGLIWLPNGYGRTCTGGGAFNQTVRLQAGRREARIIVSRAGRIRTEVEAR
ncbi:MAG TPA: GspH/FimT family protein [Deinococcales bacterium]|nr:GspH/FimT family protein [Deinococcales bacterium]